MEVFPDTTKGNHFVSIDAQNVAISDIIKAAAKELKINFFMFSDPKGNTTSKIHKAGFEDLLSYLLQGTEHTFKKEGKVYLIGERDFRLHFLNTRWKRGGESKIILVLQDLIMRSL